MISIGGGSIRLWGLLDDIELNNLELEEVDESKKSGGNSRLFIAE